MSLKCSDCEDGIVNSNSRLLLEAVNAEYEPNELEYEWEIFTVEDGEVFN